MELLFVVVIGAVIGAIVRYTLPGRTSYGSALLPAIGAAVGSVIWVGLLWLGLRFDGTWIWVASIGAAVLVPIVVAIVLPRRRAASDEALLLALSRG